jgi:hypothetical protein
VSGEHSHEILTFDQARERLARIADAPAAVDAMEECLRQEAARREEAIRTFIARANQEKRLGDRLARCPVEELKKHGLVSDFDQVDLRFEPVIARPFQLFPCVIECFWDVKAVAP